MDKEQALQFITSQINTIACPICGVTDCEHEDRLKLAHYESILSEDWIKIVDFKEVAGHTFVVLHDYRNKPYTVFNRMAIAGEPSLQASTVTMKLLAISVGELKGSGSNMVHILPRYPAVKVNVDWEIATDWKEVSP